MLDYKLILTKYFVLHMSGREIASDLHASKSGVNGFLQAFKACDTLSYPLPEGITNYGIAEQVYGTGTDHAAGSRSDTGFVQPDYADIYLQMTNRKNMTLVFLWSRYKNQCIESDERFYSYRQYCVKYAAWLEENHASMHFDAVCGQSIEVDFAGKTFEQIDRLNGDINTIVVFVAVLPYSQYIYAEGMLSTKEPEWITVNNHMLRFFGGVTPLVVCDNCKQAVSVNQDWINPDLNKDYAEWADHNHTAIMPAKVRRPRFKSSVENAVGILEKGFFHELEEMTFFSLDAFNDALHERLNTLNENNFKGKEYSRYDMWLEEKETLMPIPSVQYQYTERKEAKVSSDYHVRFDNSYYSVPYKQIHKPVLISATTSTVTIYTIAGQKLCEWPRSTSRGQWMTDPDHLPPLYRGKNEWNAPFFQRKATIVGPNTLTVIKHVLTSRKYEVQTYRQCVGILDFAKKYGGPVLEACCKQAVETNRMSYNFIKNSIRGIAAQASSGSESAKLNAIRNEGAYLRDTSATSIDRLLSKSKTLMDTEGGDSHEEQ